MKNMIVLAALIFTTPLAAQTVVTSNNTPAVAAVPPFAAIHIAAKLFPDGTCGVAINGTPVTRGLSGAPARDNVAIVLGGQTVLSRLLIGPVKLWSGVPTDVDWSRLGHAPKP